MAKKYKTQNFIEANTHNPMFINPAHVIYITSEYDGTSIHLSNGRSIKVMSDYADVQKWLEPHFGYHYDDGND